MEFTCDVMMAYGFHDIERVEDKFMEKSTNGEVYQWLLLAIGNLQGHRKYAIGHDGSNIFTSFPTSGFSRGI